MAPENQAGWREEDRVEENGHLKEWRESKGGPWPGGGGRSQESRENEGHAKCPEQGASRSIASCPVERLAQLPGPKGRLGLFPERIQTGSPTHQRRAAPSYRVRSCQVSWPSRQSQPVQQPCGQQTVEREGGERFQVRREVGRVGLSTSPFPHPFSLTPCAPQTAPQCWATRAPAALPDLSLI